MAEVFAFSQQSGSIQPMSLPLMNMFSSLMKVQQEANKVLELARACQTRGS
jgi:hypothetical protein